MADVRHTTNEILGTRTRYGDRQYCSLDRPTKVIEGSCCSSLATTLPWILGEGVGPDTARAFRLLHVPDVPVGDSPAAHANTRTVTSCWLFREHQREALLAIAFSPCWC